MANELAQDTSYLLRTMEIVRRRRLLAFLAFAAVLASAIAFVRYLPDLYRAGAIVLVERQLPETYVQAAVSGELESRLHVIKQEVLSRARLTDLINRFNLYEDLRAENDMDSVLEQMRQDIQIELTGPEQVTGRTKTVAFNLTFTGVSREIVADVTNAIAAFYVEQNNQMRSMEAARTTQFLKAQLDAAKMQLDRDEADVRAFTDKHVGELPQQVDVNLATLERLNTQLRLNGERQLRTLEQREKLFEIPIAAAVVTRAPSESPMQARLDKLKRDLLPLEGFPDKHPDVKRIKDEIATLEAEIKRGAAATTSHADGAAATPAPVRTRTLEGLDAELEQLKADEAALRQNIAMFERRLEGVPYRQNEFARISRDHQATKDLYNSLLKRYEEAQLAESMETANQGERFRVLEPAVAPMGPRAPNRPRLLIMGLLLAILAAGFAVLIAEQFDTSFHTVDDLRQFTSVPVLASIPRVAPKGAGPWFRGALTAVGVVAAVTLVATLSAYVADGNEPLVRMLVRAG
jgi:polysaccharide chain length determinant protein (PEP-CTERM system associated)